MKYGFLSTYKSTVFVRRSDKYRFELSQPLNEGATSPSIRECFVGLCAIASNDRTFVEDDFNEMLVSSFASYSNELRAESKIQLQVSGAQASVRPAPYRSIVASAAQQAAVRVPPQGGSTLLQSENEATAINEITDLALGVGTILFGCHGVARSSVNCVRLISGSPMTKAVMEIEYKGIRATAKCWTEQYFSRLAETIKFSQG